MPVKTGVIILTVSRGYQSQKIGLFSFNPPLRGDFDHGKIMKPVKSTTKTSGALFSMTSGSGK